jgi:hypothetical protein
MRCVRLETPSAALLAVIDRAAGVPAALGALRDATGLPDSATELLRAADGELALDATGARHGPLGRLVRALQFTLMDQLPDLAWYEAALRDGRAVLRVRIRDLETARRAAAALEAAGAHFINHFGRFETASLVPWRGPEPAVPSVMKR